MTMEEKDKKIEDSAPAATEKAGDGDTKVDTKADPAPEEKKEEKPVEPPPPPPPKVHKTDFEKDTVYLFQFGRNATLPSMSPYCLKVETWLRLNGIKYENVDHKVKLRSAKGQLPFVELNGEEIPDSALIIQKVGQHFGVDPDGQLTKDERNNSHALISMIENHLNWVYVYWRSKNPDAMIKGFKLNLQQQLGSKIPNVLLSVFFKFSYSRKGAKKVKAHGLGVHSPEEVFEFGKGDLMVLEESLGDKDFFFGEKPSNLDAVAFAHLSQIAYVDKSVPYDLRDWMEEHCPKLMGHLSRMKERCFPDWEDMTTKLMLNPHLVEEKKEEPAKEKEDLKDEKEKDEKVEEIKDEKVEEKKEEKK